MTTGNSGRASAEIPRAVQQLTQREDRKYERVLASLKMKASQIETLLEKMNDQASEFCRQDKGLMTMVEYDHVLKLIRSYCYEVRENVIKARLSRRY